MKSRLQLRIEPKLLERSRKLAKSRNLTLTALVEGLLSQTLADEDLKKRIIKDMATDAEQI